MKTFTIIGNCQISIINFLLTNNIFVSKYTYIVLPLIHLITETELEFFNKTISTVDLLIIQPINNNYRNIEDLGTYNIILKTKASCKIILFPSLYLEFYFPFSTYIINKETNQHLKEPIDYHDSNLFNICKTNSSFETVLENFKEIINNKNITTKQYLTQIFEKSINELIIREKKYPTFIPDNCKYRSSIIFSSEFINNNYKKCLLFYSMNHPTKYLFHYISDSIFKILDISLTLYASNIDPLIHNNVPILYKVLQDIVEFNISDIPIVINNKIIKIDEFVKIYYDIYSTLNLLEFKNI